MLQPEPSQVVLRTARRAASAVAGVLLLMSFGAPTLDAQPIPKGNWIELASPHFTIYSNATAGKTEDVATELDLLRQVLERLDTGRPTGATAPLTIVIFRNDEAFRPYMRTPPTKGTVRSWEGFYGDLRDYLLLNGSRPAGELLPWAFSAYANHFLSYRHPRLPFWLRRGMSEFHATAEIDRKGSVRLGIPDSQHLRTLRERSTLPLAQFFQIDRSSSFLASRQGGALHQAQAWALTHFILTGADVGPGRGSEFFRLVAGGLSEEEAIRQAFNVDLDSFERSLRDYVNSRTMPVFSLKDQQFVNLDVPAREMASAEVAYQLGLYLATAHDPPPVELSERHLQPLVDVPNLGGDALATLGELRRRSGRPADATSLFERALTARPGAASSYYFIARHLAEQGLAAHRGRIQTALRRALELEPSFGDAYVRLDQTFGPDQGEAAIANLERAVEVLAGREDVAYNLVMRYLYAGDVEAARRVAEEHLSAAGGAGYRDRALSHIASREESAAQERRFEAFNRAVRLYNERDFAGARREVEALLEGDDGGEVESRARDLLEAIELAEEHSS